MCADACDGEHFREVCSTSDLEIGWAYAKKTGSLAVTARLIDSGFCNPLV